MEEKINISEILKDKKNGLRLYSPIFGECAFCCVRNDTNDICVKKHNGVKEFFDSKGLYYNTGEVMLFPSKSMRDWSKFAWKKGDVLVSMEGSKILFDRWANEDYTKFLGKIKVLGNSHCYDTANYSLASKEEALEFIKSVEEINNGKLNLETLRIEKSEFKDGDIVVYGKSVAICRKFYKHTLCFYVSLNDMFGLLFNDEVESSEEYRFATEEEKQQLFSALEKEGKDWDAEKKEVVNLKPKCEFKPFDKVLVRDGKDEIWEPAFFFRNLSQFCEYNYQTVGGEWRVYCIPYIGNESLLGTTKDVEG